jgi:hypothetical protein
MSYHPYEEINEEQYEEREIIRYLSWKQKRRIVAVGFILMTILGFILAVSS